MFRALPLLALIAVPAAAAERSVAITNFDRIRVDGAFDVRVTTRATPTARISGDARALDLVSVRVDGGTLLVRAERGGWGERGRVGEVPAPVIHIQTRELRSASVVGGGQLAVAGPVGGERVDLTVTGAGSLAIPMLAAGQVVATLIGTATMTLGGSARGARLIGNGAGRISAEGLTAGDVTVRTEGTTSVAVTARYTAAAFSTGLGPIEILGRPECKGKAQAGGSIRCAGKPLPEAR